MDKNARIWEVSHRATNRGQEAWYRTAKISICWLVDAQYPKDEFNIGISVWTLTIVMVGVFINELVVNSKAQGTPVSMKVS